MRHWLNDQYFRSVLKNTSYLAIAKGVAAVCGLVTLALAGRSLGVLQLGMLILIVSYVQAASGLTKFQTWQIPVRFGGRVLHGEQIDEFKIATGFAFALDVLSGAVGLVAAVALLPLLGPWFGLPADHIREAMWFCLLLPTMAAATPNGVVRALDRFDLISWSDTVTPLSRMVLTIAGWWWHWPFGAWLLIWFVSGIAGDLFAWFVAIRELRRRDLMRGIRPTLKPHMLAGAWSFAIQVNLTSSLASAWGSIGRLLVGAFLGPASTALYRVAATLADSTQKPADLLGRAYYPEVARMDFTSKHPWRLMKRSMVLSMLISGVAVLVIILGGRSLLGTVFGHPFVAAYPALMILLLVPMLTILSFPLPATLYALDRPDAPLKARIVATVVYLATIYPSCHYFGLQGAAFAYLGANLVLFAVLAVYTLREHRRVRPR